MKWLACLLFLGSACGIVRADTGPLEFVYVAGSDSASVQQYQVLPDGTLFPLDPPGVQTGMGDQHGGVAVSLTGRFVYVTDTNRDAVTEFRAGADGALSPLAPATVAAGHGPMGISLGPGGRFAYVMDRDAGAICQYRLTAAGQLIPLSPTSVRCFFRPQSIAFDSTGRFAYVTGPDGTATYGVTGGALTPTSAAPVQAGRFPEAAAFTPDGRFAYIPCLDGVYQYRAGTGGTLTPLTPAMGGTGGATILSLGQNIAVDGTGRFVYVVRHVNNGNGLIDQYRVGVDGALSPLTPPTVDTPNAPVAVRIDPANQFAYVTTLDDMGARYRIGANGALTPLPPPFRCPGGALAVARHQRGFVPAPRPRVTHALPPPLLVVPARPAFVYVASTDTNSISEFQTLPDGQLSPLGSQDTGSGPESLATDPRGRFLYAACPGHSEIRQYAIQTDGTLAALDPPAVHAGTSPVCLAMMRDGHHIYAINDLDGTLSAFTVGGDGGLAPLGVPVKTPPRPEYVGADPTGHWLYVVPNGGWPVAFPVGPDGVPEAGEMLPERGGFGAVPVFTLDGRYALVTSSNSSVVPYQVGAGSALTPLPRQSLAATPSALAVEPGGRFAYVTNSFDNTVSQFQIGPDGALVPLSPPTVISGSQPGPLAFDPGGHYAYVLDEKDAAVGQYRIGADGGLSPLTPAQIPCGPLTFNAAPNLLVVVPR